MRIFLYECVSAGGLGANVPASLRREGRAMLAAVVADFQRLPAVEVVTLLDDPEEAKRFGDIAAACDWTLVIAPEFDDLLLQRNQTVLAVGGRLLGSFPAAIRAAGDKWETASIWRSRAVPHPRTERCDPLSLAHLEVPCVLKPRHGAGSQATFLVREEQDKTELYSAAQRERPHGELIVQRYVPGEAASVALLLGGEQVIPLLPARQHLSNDGRFHYLGGSLPLPDLLAARAQRLAQAAVAGIDGLQGYVGVDLVLGRSADGSDDYAIEINPRLTTSYLGLRRLCRQNLVELMLSCMRGETIESPDWLPGEVRF